MSWCRAHSLRRRDGKGGRRLPPRPDSRAALIDIVIAAEVGRRRTVGGPEEHAVLLRPLLRLPLKCSGELINVVEIFGHAVQRVAEVRKSVVAGKRGDIL